MCSIDPAQGNAGGGGRQSSRRVLGRAAVGLGASPRGDVEAGPRRRYGNSFMTSVQIWDTGQRAGPLPVARHVHPQGSHKPKPGGCHHLRAAARREGPSAGALGPVRCTRFTAHYYCSHSHHTIYMFMVPNTPYSS